jgi:hypothetical protein
MNAKPPVRLIKNAGPNDPKIQAEVESAASSNRWSTAVRSWVVEFQRRDRNESLPAFDSLFNDALPELRHGD